MLINYKPLYLHFKRSQKILALSSKEYTTLLSLGLRLKTQIKASLNRDLEEINITHIKVKSC